MDRTLSAGEQVYDYRVYEEHEDDDEYREVEAVDKPARPQPFYFSRMVEEIHGFKVIALFVSLYELLATGAAGAFLQFPHEPERIRQFISVHVYIHQGIISVLGGSGMIVEDAVPAVDETESDAAGNELDDIQRDRHAGVAVREVESEKTGYYSHVYSGKRMYLIFYVARVVEVLLHTVREEGNKVFFGHKPYLRSYRPVLRTAVRLHFFLFYRKEIRLSTFFSSERRPDAALLPKRRENSIIGMRTVLEVMRMELSYEPARKEDAETLFEFNRELIERYEDPGSIDLQEVLAWVRRKLEKRLGEYVRVTADGRLAGYYRLCLDGGEAELDDLYILPEYRGLGIGTAVVGKCCADAGRPVKLYVFVKNEKAVSLYRRLGFEVTEKVGETRYIMRRDPETEDGKMKEIEIFYLKGCPYCMKARKAVGELQAENAAYAGLELRWIEESENPDLADSRDYYNVPTLFCGGEKLYEAKPIHGYDMIKGSIRSAFDKVLSEE